MCDGFFRGPLAIGFIIANLSWGVASAVMIFMGGAPREPIAGQYVLSNHGLTEVTRAMWVGAQACEWIMVLGWILMIGFATALYVRKEKYVEHDPRTNYAVLVLIGVVLSMLLPILAVACAPHGG